MHVHDMYRVFPVFSSDVFSGVYREFTVAIKTLKQESADSAAVAEFSREAAILT